MQVEVTKPYKDRDTREVHRKGDSVSYERERAEELRRLGFVDFVEVSEPTVKELRDLCEAKGVKAPRNATKAKLKELLGGE